MRRPDGTTLMPELWRRVAKFLSPSEILIFKRTSRLGQQVTANLLSGRIVVATGWKAFIFDTDCFTS